MPGRLRFDWDDANRSHIARHQVSPEEAEQVIGNYPLEIEAVIRKGEFRRLCIGRTLSGRLLTVVYVLRRGRVRVVTAYPPNLRLRRLYDSQ